MPTKKKKPNFSKQFLGKSKFKIRKYKDISFFSGRSRYSIYTMILLFLGIVVFNLHPESNQDIQIFPVEIKEKPQLTYLYQSKEGAIYDIF
jgi:hypothetical protein